MIPNAKHSLQSAALDDATRALIETNYEIARKHGVSPLSAATIILQAVMLGVKELGGHASKPYMRLMIDGTFCSDPVEGQKLTRRAYTFMEGMARYYNAEIAREKSLRTLTMNEAMAIADALEVTPETMFTDGAAGQVEFYCPTITAKEWPAYLAVMTNGLALDPATVTVSDAQQDDGSAPCAHVVIRTEG